MNNFYYEITRYDLNVNNFPFNCILKSSALDKIAAANLTICFITALNPLPYYILDGRKRKDNRYRIFNPTIPTDFFLKSKSDFKIGYPKDDSRRSMKLQSVDYCLLANYYRVLVGRFADKPNNVLKPI